MAEQFPANLMRPSTPQIVPEIEEELPRQSLALAANFYRLLLRHPLTLFVGAWYRAYEYAFFNRDHGAWLFEVLWGLWLALTLPLFPLASLPMMAVVGKAVTTDLGGLDKTHAMNMRVEVTYFLDAAVRFYRGCDKRTPVNTASKAFWVEHFNTHGARTTAVHCLVSQIGEPGGAVPRLPKEDLLAKEVCSYYGLGTVVLRYQPEGDRYLVCAADGSTELLDEAGARASLRRWGKDRMLQRFVAPHAHLGTHSLRLSTFRLGLGGKPVLSYGYYTQSEGATTAQNDAGSNIAYYLLDYGRSRVGAHICNGKAREDVPGKALPGLADAIEEALKLHEALEVGCHTHFGWDVALTPDGPTFFEANMCCGGFRGLLTWRPWFQLPHDLAVVDFCTNDAATVDWDKALTAKERQEKRQK